MELHGRYTFFAEGARGHLTKQVKARLRSRCGTSRKVYGIGLKELWDVDPEKHVPAASFHTQGWPLDDAWGGGFIYHQENNQSRWASWWRSTTAIRISRLRGVPALEAASGRSRDIGGAARRVSYGARAINEGGYQAIPKLAFPGGVLIGCSAGFVNVPRIKGSHTAIKSGHARRRSRFRRDRREREQRSLDAYDQALHSSWVADELKMVRNVEPMVAKYGGMLGTMLPAPTCGCAI
jgi:electron-transferring-flavoprotein dehydrogenase